MHTPATILLIDDEASFVRGLARLLHRDGYTVDTAANGQHALAQLRAQRYDVVLCDLHMPALDGPTLYTIMQQQSPALCQRMIFLSQGIPWTSRAPHSWRSVASRTCTSPARPPTSGTPFSSGWGSPRPPRLGCQARGSTDRGESMPEDGMLSILRRGEASHVRYVATNPYAQEYPPRVCPDEATLRASLCRHGTTGKL